MVVKLVLEIMDKSAFEFQCAELARGRMITAIITISFAEILIHTHWDILAENDLSQVVELSDPK
jgi:hypothetical protein